jgi:Zn-dependent M28 family amino/carboxypeptidase
MRSAVAVLAVVVIVVSGFAGRTDLQGALASIRQQEIRAHLRFLAHDLLEGRAPGTRGGELAALYIATQLAGAGAEPVRGTHLQRVPLVGRTVDAERLLLGFEIGARTLTARHPAEAVVWTATEDTAPAVAAELVFVGYGVRAPEYRWDDFKDRDLRGKILLFLINDPPAPPEEAALFDGRGMTYYGRWTYKLEEAERQGAAGALIIHTTEGAGYPWTVVQTSWGGETFSLPRGGDGPQALALAGWLHRDFARRLLAAAGLSLEELQVLAARRDFRPVATGIHLRATVPGRIRQLVTSNVVGLVPGSDPVRRGEFVIYTAHYDHLGIGPAVDGDSIYNGAYDNASGVAVLLALARAFARLDPAPPRSILFLATTAEEAGILGAEHYVRQPLFALNRTAAVINIDGANLWGETDDVIALGAERSTLGRIVEARARQEGMRLVPDRAPEKGLFFRSDHFPFARVGIPAISLDHGIEFRGRPAGWGAEVLERYEATSYHRPADRYSPTFDMAGAVQQARLAFMVGYDVAHAQTPPELHPRGSVESARERPARRGTR